MAQIDPDRRKQIEDISFALVTWFESQDVNPSLAGAVMANLIASQLIGACGDEDEIDENELNEGYHLFGRMLQEMIGNKCRKYRRKAAH